jgi:cysteate synthase
MYGISNVDTRTAQNLFERYEGIDIFPPAAVAVASLIEAVNNSVVDAEEHIVLNITGGGVKRLEMDYGIYKIEPEAHAENANVPLEDILRKKVFA